MNSSDAMAVVFFAIIYGFGWFLLGQAYGIGFDSASQGVVFGTMVMTWFFMPIVIGLMMSD